MIVVLKHNPNPEQLQSLITWLQEKGIIIHTSIGEGNMLLGLVGDTSKIDADLISALDIVEDVKRVQEPYKNANRKFHPEDTVVKVGNTQIGGGNLTLMAGPCSVESEEQVVAIAKAVKASGATMLRGGAFKPRTSPYSFQGLGEVGLRYLEIAKEETGLPIVTELMDLSQLPLFKNVDVIQIGARNMQNFDLLKAVGRLDKPVLLKRGLSVKWYILGYGDRETQIREAIQAVHMEDFVVLLGKKENPYPYIRMCDIYVQPSVYEGKCVAVREAQLLGKPVIITDFSTAHSQLQDGTDGMIAPLDFDGFTDALAALIQDNEKQEALKAACRSTDFTQYKEAEKILRFAEGRESYAEDQRHCADLQRRKISRAVR